MEETEDIAEEPVARGENRQPIVSVLGHVDHGKTSVLDLVRSLGSERQASVMDREAGGITQHIGATEVPAKILNETCAELMQGRPFKSPGLLFIDTPGHHSFASLRNRGGALADIAILVVDIMEGLQPQTIESINILKQTKTPFVIAGNKIDRIHGWRCQKDRSFLASLEEQRQDVVDLFQQRFWKLVGQVSEHGINLERYDQIKDFKQSFPLVPMSAKEGEGLQDLLTVTVGLAERFLEDRLTDTLGPAEGTILEMKDEIGMGKTIDVILHRGSLNVTDTITVVSADGPFDARIKGLKRARGMSEMRDAGDRWESVDTIDAAAGVKIIAQGLEKALAGTTIRLSSEEAWEEARKETQVSVELDEEGIVIKADTIGGLEALAFELKKIEVPIRRATVGPVNKRDLMTAEAASSPLNQIILGFSIEPNNEVRALVNQGDESVTWIGGDIIYHIIDQFEEWKEERKKAIDAATRENLIYPGKLLYLENHTFRNKGPAIVGMRVLGGRVHLGQRLMKVDGTAVGQIRSLRSRSSDELKEAKQGEEVAVAIMGPTVGRHIEELDLFYVDIPESHVPRLAKVELTELEKEILEEIINLHRKDDHFWGRRHIA
ncbi:MAG: translation initiation factor IF-2 [Candidatus Poseidoniaceae archaeon]|nr:translation initiation factor IF-2 [Candidatus Poseidoniaceae archaeon]MBL6889921.1 translation initiation factor IF-2 [Candidatus Poseidoniaceae archaeon]